MITDEIGKTANIKDRTNAKAVTDALSSVKEKLKNYKKTGNTGLVVYSGMVLMEDNKTEKKLCTVVVPPKDINTKVFNCGDHFITQPLKDLLIQKEKYGFVVVDGNGCLFGIL